MIMVSIVIRPKEDRIHPQPFLNCQLRSGIASSDHHAPLNFFPHLFLSGLKSLKLFIPSQTCACSDVLYSVPSGTVKCQMWYIKFRKKAAHTIRHRYIKDEPLSLPANSYDLFPDLANHPVTRSSTHLGWPSETQLDSNFIFSPPQISSQPIRQSCSF